MKAFIGPYPYNPNKKRIVRVQIDHHDLWSLDMTLAHIILPALKAYRDSNHGMPASFGHDENGNDIPYADGYAKWIEVLNKMIWSFEQILDETAEIKLSVQSDRMEWVRKRQEGLDLFAEYYLSLWT